MAENKEKRVANIAEGFAQLDNPTSKGFLAGYIAKELELQGQVKKRSPRLSAAAAAR